MTVLYRYAFDAVVCDEAKAQLVVDGLDVAIQRKPLQVLLVLLAHAGQVVSREELSEAVWAGRIGETSNVLPNAMTKLRNALGFEAAARIENVPRLGYRFVGRVERTVVGRRSLSALSLSVGLAVPHRDGFVLEALMRQASGREVWLARQAMTGEARVFKFASTADAVVSLRREATVVRALFDQLGPDNAIVEVVGWNFAAEPFFIEAVHAGIDLAAWAGGGRLASLPLAERLQLFLEIATPVGAAHGVGVLHGDLKPGNLLIDEAREPRLRVHDFGSGALLGPDWADRIGDTLASGPAGRRESGTFNYLAPELHRGAVPTLQSDVFALGVLLYQVVIGDFDCPLAPAWPEDVPDEFLREDIAAATAVDPSERTASVDDLIRGLERLDERRARRAREHEAERVGRARREALERARQRRPWLVAVVGLLAVGFATTALLWLQAQRARQDLFQRDQVTTALNRFLVDDFIARANPLVSGRPGLTVAQALTEAAERIDDTLRSAGPETRARIHAAMRDSFHAIGEFERAVREAHAALRALDESGTPDAATAATIRLGLAATLVDLARKDEAVAELASATRLIDDAGLRGGELEARLWLVRGWSAGQKLALDEQRDDVRRAAAVLGEVADPSPELREQVLFASAEADRMTGRFETALAAGNDLLARQARRWGVDDPRVCFTRVLNAATLGYLERLDEALPLGKSAAACLDARLGATNLRAVSADAVVADLYYQAGRWDEAAAAYRDVATRFASLTAPTSLRTLDSRMNAASALRFAGRLDEAERETASLLDAARTAWDETNPMVESARYRLAAARLDLHRTDGVEALLDGLSPDVLSQSQIAPDWEGRLLFERGRLALESHDWSTAVSLLESAVRSIHDHAGSGSLPVAGVERALEQARQAKRSSAQRVADRAPSTTP